MRACLCHAIRACVHAFAKALARARTHAPKRTQTFCSHVRAGVLVSERRWNLKLNNGVDVKLPETDPAAAAASLARLQREGRIIEKDIVAIDMRMPGRAIARLSEDAANARAEALARKPKGKGGTT